MGRVASVGRDNEGGVCSRAGPLLDDIAFVALEFDVASENGRRRVVFEISTGSELVCAWVNRIFPS